MLSLIVTLPLSLLLWFFAVAILAGSLASFAAATYYLYRSIWIGLGGFLGGIVGWFIWGGFALIVAYGALGLGAGVVDGLIVRLL